MIPALRVGRLASLKRKSPLYSSCKRIATPNFKERTPNVQCFCNTSQKTRFYSTIQDEDPPINDTKTTGSGLTKEELRQRRWYRRFAKFSRQKMLDEIEDIRKFSLRKWVAILGGIAAFLGAVEVIWSNITETEMYQRRRAARLLRSSKMLLPASEAAQSSIIFRTDLVQQLRDLRRPNKPELCQKVVIVCGDSGSGKSTLIQSAFHRQSGVVYVDLLESLKISEIASEVLRQMRFSHELAFANSVNYLKNLMSEIKDVEMFSSTKRFAHLLRESPMKVIRRLGDSLGQIPFSLEDSSVDFGRVKPLIILNISPTSSAASEMLSNSVKLARAIHESGVATVLIECSDSVAIAKLIDGPSKHEHQDRINIFWVNPLKPWRRRSIGDQQTIINSNRSQQTNLHLRTITERLQGPALPVTQKKNSFIPVHPYKQLLQQLLVGPVSIDKAALSVMQRSDSNERETKDDPWVREVISFMAQRLGISDPHNDKKDSFALGSEPRLSKFRHQILSDLVRHDGILSYRPDKGELNFLNDAAYDAAVLYFNPPKPSR